MKTKKRTARFEIFESDGCSVGKGWASRAGGAWHWRLRAKNGRIIADGSEGYSSRAAVKRAIKNLESTFADQFEYRLWTALRIVEVEA